ncbi:phosphatidate cytidylyltransferase [Coraliomargarita sp. SDUM461003]|uniref:Phosphatidate cytidylyltransferase n=1 Tax=Thalassobacterium maritimum TaxID=3041265 RepID=A0ABU1ASC9_9BACT|nr:phosphatidate cytidylyltransferase [Coraliomargarita sp. SDUM461003]MBT64526.1 phosphatidate cytidylyltransferase [Puniceicoccaceae bacterium]MDQ8206045.1 phosphatidate cytidylyltransferase [Coraliomargarita sp. SDUM461003]HBR93969.1 phosphatidate cytidylyltransferase [Opitutae bacterium]|tara:strand:- start:11512 stop:12342 length:831 start_codon:yes stop_codon:yes gene_type:complete
MQQRIFSFAALWSILAISLWLFGVHAGVFLVAILAALTQLELYQLFEKMGLKPMIKVGIAAGAVITVGSYYIGGIDSGNDLFVLSFVVLTLAIIRLDLQAGRLRSFMPTLFGLLYVPYLLHFLIKIVKLAEINGESAATGMFLAVWTVAVAKCSDVGGLLVGMKLGKTPLSVISPKKTYEGAAGGIAFSMLIGIILTAVFHSLAPAGFTWWLCALIAIPIGIASIASDLVESAFKRQADVKDSGKIIPGIGGIFDLTDSLILTAPLSYLFFKYTLF